MMEDLMKSLRNEAEDLRLQVRKLQEQLSYAKMRRATSSSYLLMWVLLSQLSKQNEVLILLPFQGIPRGAREMPVEFEKDHDEADPFGLGLERGEKGKKALEKVGTGGTLRASAGSAMKESYDGRNASMYAYEVVVSGTATLPRNFYLWPPARAISSLLEAISQERKSLLILEDVERGVTLRSLVADWQITCYGKETLMKMEKKVNAAYTKAQQEGVIEHHHKVRSGDMIQELKHLVRGKEQVDETLKTLVIDAITTKEFSGKEFAEIISAYVQTNEQVHVKWTLDKLKRVLKLAKNEKLALSGTAWVEKMVVDISKSHGWSSPLPDKEENKPATIVEIPLSTGHQSAYMS